MVVKQNIALGTAKYVWMWCSHALASVTFHNTSVFNIHSAAKVHSVILYHQRTASGRKSYELRGRLSELPLCERTCLWGQHESTAIFRTSPAIYTLFSCWPSFLYCLQLFDNTQWAQMCLLTTSHHFLSTLYTSQQFISLSEVIFGLIVSFLNFCRQWESVTTAHYCFWKYIVASY